MNGRLFTEHDVEELFVFSGLAPDYRVAEAALRMAVARIEARVERVPSTAHRLMPVRVGLGQLMAALDPHGTNQELQAWAATQGEGGMSTSGAAHPAAEPMIGRIVWYRSRTGNYTVPAMIVATHETLMQAGVEAWRESAGMKGVPPLSGERNVHLVVYTPGIAAVAGQGVLAEDFVATSPLPVQENVAGTYQEWDVEFFDPEGLPVSCAPDPVFGEAEMLAGTWTWPSRRP